MPKRKSKAQQRSDRNNWYQRLKKNDKDRYTKIMKQQSEYRTSKIYIDKKNPEVEVSLGTLNLRRCRAKQAGKFFDENQYVLKSNDASLVPLDTKNNNFLESIKSNQTPSQENINALESPKKHSPKNEASKPKPISTRRKKKSCFKESEESTELTLTEIEKAFSIIEESNVLLSQDFGPIQPPEDQQHDPFCPELTYTTYETRFEEDNFFTQLIQEDDSEKKIQPEDDIQDLSITNSISIEEYLSFFDTSDQNKNQQHQSSQEFTSKEDTTNLMEQKPKSFDNENKSDEKLAISKDLSSPFKVDEKAKNRDTIISLVDEEIEVKSTEIKDRQQTMNLGWYDSADDIADCTSGFVLTWDKKYGSSPIITGRCHNGEFDKQKKERLFKKIEIKCNQADNVIKIIFTAQDKKTFDDLIETIKQIGEKIKDTNKELRVCAYCYHEKHYFLLILSGTNESYNFQLINTFTGQAYDIELSKIEDKIFKEFPGCSINQLNEQFQKNGIDCGPIVLLLGQRYMQDGSLYDKKKIGCLINENPGIKLREQQWELILKARSNSGISANTPVPGSTSDDEFSENEIEGVYIWAYKKNPYSDNTLDPHDTSNDARLGSTDGISQKSTSKFERNRGRKKPESKKRKKESYFTNTSTENESSHNSKPTLSSFFKNLQEKQDVIVNRTGQKTLSTSPQEKSRNESRKKRKRSEKNNAPEGNILFKKGKKRKLNSTEKNQDPEIITSTTSPTVEPLNLGSSKTSIRSRFFSQAPSRSINDSSPTINNKNNHSALPEIKEFLMQINNKKTS